jgi:hypothetical protein
VAMIAGGIWDLPFDITRAAVAACSIGASSRSTEVGQESNDLHFTSIGLLTRSYFYCYAFKAAIVS